MFTLFSRKSGELSVIDTPKSRSSPSSRPPHERGVSEAKRLRELEAENARLKKLLAESTLDNPALKEVVSGKW